MEEASKSVVDLINSLLPGFLAAWVFYGLTAHPKTEKFERVVQALIFTALIQGLTVLVEWALLAIGHVFSVGQWTQNCALVWSLVLGVLLGLIFARFANTNCLHHWLWQWPLYDRVRQHRGMRWLPAWGWTSRTSYPSEWFSAFTQEKRQVVLHLSGGRRLHGWPEEWPDHPDKGHFIILHPEWLLDNGHIGHLHKVEKMLVPAKEVEMVEFLKEPDEVTASESEIVATQEMMVQLQGESYGVKVPTKTSTTEPVGEQRHELSAHQ